MINESSCLNLAPENWVINIERMLLDENIVDTKVCILKVNKKLLATKPEAYTPQIIGFGPYHHWREDLYEMEQYKLIASRSALKASQKDEAVERLKQLVHGLKRNEITRIRACYDRHLDVDDDPLAWMMVVDGTFLLQFLQVFVNPKRSCLSSSTRTSHLVDPKQSTYHSIVKDMMKLENQIPIFVLKHILSASDIVDQDQLPVILLTACMKISPFKYETTQSQEDITEYSHLLGLLYHMIVPHKSREEWHHFDVRESSENKGSRCEEKQPRFSFPEIPTPSLGMVGNLNIKLVHVVTNHKPLQVLERMAGLVVAAFPSFSNPSSIDSRRPMTDVESGENSSFTEGRTGEAPKSEEIGIPPVSSLLNVGIEFCPSNAPVTCIEFDGKTRKFHLPTVAIDDYSEVIMRNLAAYEAAAAPNSLVLARFIQLMAGIIDTAEDVKLLRDRGIIVSGLNNDAEIALLWNGISKGIRSSYVNSIDKVIKEVNEYYHSKTKVKIYKVTKSCMFCGWRILMLLTALFVFVLMGIQSFCSVYRCPRVLSPDAVQAI